MRNLLTAALALASVSCSSCCTDRVGLLDPSAADPVLPVVVDGFLEYLEADATLDEQAKGDRRMAAEALRSWWIAGLEEQQAAAAAGGGQ